MDRWTFPTPHTQTAKEQRSSQHFSAKLPFVTNEEDDKYISSSGQDGKRPDKNPEPSFHFAIIDDGGLVDRRGKLRIVKYYATLFAYYFTAVV